MCAVFDLLTRPDGYYTVKVLAGAFAVASIMFCVLYFLQPDPAGDYPDPVREEEEDFNDE